MRPLRTIIAAIPAVTTAVAVGMTPAAATPSESSDFSDCAYPYVCLYKWDGSGWHKTGQFRQFTRGWQYLTVSYGAQELVNTRHDDVVYVLHTDGLRGCFPPNNPRDGEIAPIAAIRIDPSSVCTF
jgi:hypothetical protein